MGLTACGNFMISYKRSVDEGLSSDYNFSNGFKYELYFWIYVPHSLLSKYYNVCLFDDHSVDDLKVVTMTQWSSDLRTLIIHGASEIDDQDSFISLIRIPKMGCLDCKIMRDNEFLEISEHFLKYLSYIIN